MELTGKDILTMLSMVFIGAGVYAALLQRVTRMEAMQQRVERIEREVATLQENSTTLAVLVSTVESLAARVFAVEGTVNNGIADILAALAAKDRRKGPEPS